MNCSETVIVELISAIVPQSYTICGRIYMEMYSLPAGGAVGAGHYMEDETKMTSKMFWRQLVSFRNTVI